MAVVLSLKLTTADVVLPVAAALVSTLTVTVTSAGTSIKLFPSRNWTKARLSASVNVSPCLKLIGDFATAT